MEKKLEELMAKMNLDEKVGQMTQVDIDGMQNPEDVAKYYIGSMLAGGNSEPSDITAKGWANVYDQYQTQALKTRLAIPMIFGIDAVHGHNNVDGAVIFPHNVGLGATRNPELVEKACGVVAEEIAATGIDWTFAPCLAVARNERWGRTYESFGESPELIKMMAGSCVRGFQGVKLGQTGILACAKHYLGDGGTTDGKDQGNTECDERTLRNIHLSGYPPSIEAGVGSVMVSYNSWNGQKMHGNKYLLTDVLKVELGFQGIVVSDWAAIDQLGTDYKKDVEASINAGLDMIMIPNGPGKKNNYVEFITYLKELVNEGKVPMSRIDDAVRRILRVKMALGLFEHPYAAGKAEKFVKKFGSVEHREVARECVRQSLVLLKNENKLLPLSKTTSSILVAGGGADNIGKQCGGWTISWQGKCGNVISGGTTIWQAMQNTVSKTTNLIYLKDGNYQKKADAAVVVIGEIPYAEMFGDRSELGLSDENTRIIAKIKEQGTPVVVVMITGRPMPVPKILELSDAFVVAWLPGTEGQGVVDVLFGDYKPTGKLPHSWPRDMRQIPINSDDKTCDPLFPYGFGLTY